MPPHSDAAEPHAAFDEETGGLAAALRSGYLPARFFGPETKGMKRIKQIIPASERDAVQLGNDSDDRYRAVCYALLTNSRGETVLEPVLAYTCCEGDELENDDDRFMLASDFAHSRSNQWRMAEGGVQYEYTLKVIQTDTPIDPEVDLNNAANEGFYVKHVFENRDSSDKDVLMERMRTQL
mmetsp:Transcript_8512/g.14378  ORF Transcript_8512/g.14378 Transcript_8512/m.14378 type:complete len:181 (-) Transcript_8512:373-915(-)